MLFLLFTFIVFALYWPALNAPFILDDEPNIVNAAAIHLNELSTQNLLRAGFDSHLSARPVANISFALNYYWGGLNTLGYHIVNDLIHALNGLLLYFLITTTLSRPAMRKKYGPPGLIPLGVALLWLVSPVHIQSVTYIVQRMNGLASLFYISTILLYVHARLSDNKVRKRLFFTMACITGLFGLGSKEIAATLPVFIFLYDRFFLQDQEIRWRQHLKLAGLVLVLFVVFAFIFIGSNPFRVILSGYNNYTFTLYERVITEFRVIVFYLSQLLFPHPSRLNLYHTVFTSSSILTPPTTLFSFLFIAGALGAAFSLVRRNPLVSFSIFWFFGNLVIESTVIPLQIIFEHRSYLPSMFLFILLAVLWCQYVKRRLVHLGVLCLLLAICGFWTFERNTVWSNAITFWSDASQKSPLESQPYNNLGIIYARQGNSAEAARYYTKGLQLDPANWMAHFNYALLLDKLDDLNGAIFHYNAALQLYKNLPQAHYRLALIFVDKQQYRQAIKHLEIVNRIAPGKYPDVSGKLMVYREWLRKNER